MVNYCDVLRICLLITSLGFVGCGPPPPDPKGPYPNYGGWTCSQLGWVCGIDDNGQPCGTCAYPQTCQHGACTTLSSTPPYGGIGPQLTTSTNHVVVSGMSLPLFWSAYGFAFSIPVDATVSYDVYSPSGDIFDVGIFTREDWAAYSTGGGGAGVYAERVRTSLAKNSAHIPGGGYVLGFQCQNFIQRCGVSITISAVY
jgi:hypothetical protein